MDRGAWRAEVCGVARSLPGDSRGLAIALGDLITRVRTAISDREPPACLLESSVMRATELSNEQLRALLGGSQRENRAQMHS